MSGSWARRSSGIGARWALYAGHLARRWAGEPPSNATTTRSGRHCASSCRSMRMKPNKALVGWPARVDNPRTA